MKTIEHFSLGVNYWPRRKAMGWWKSFDPGEVREDFARIAELDLDSVRIFMLWEDFQPEPFRIDESALANLGVVLDLANDANLLIQPTFFVGHMSGYNWAPAWTLSGENPDWAREFPLLASGKRSTGRVRPVYDDPWLLRAMVFNIRQVVGRFRSHPAVFGWDTGNEPDVFQRPLSRESQWLWNSLLVGEIKRLDPVHPVVCGVHIWSLDADPAPSVPIRIDDQAEINDLAIMHAYSIYCDAAKSPMDTDVVPFCCALTSHLAGKPVLFQEFGLCTAPPGAGSEAVTVRLPHRTWSQYVSSEEEAALYVGEVLEKLWRVGAVGAWIWCFTDYAPELWDRPPCDLLFHERTFGLFRSDGSPKPHADVIRRVASLGRPVCSEPVHFDFGGISPDEYYSDPRAHFRRLFAGFVWPASAGKHRPA